MKTLEQFIKEVEASEELQNELKNLKDADAANAFLKAHGCGATADELAAFIQSQAKDRQGELSDDEVSAASGGVWFDIGFGRFWVDETLPQRRIKDDPILPDSPITIIEDED